jgi:glycerophosphoryl diester phosphodiesterase
VFLDAPRPIAFAHRGGISAHPENTMASFANAVELGYRYLETDVHLSADGVLFAFHDDVLDRVTDRTGPLASLTAAEIETARVGGTEPIPRFEELLTAWPNHRFSIDPKSDASVAPLAEMLLAHRAIERVCIGAFSDARIAEMRQRCGPDLCTSMGPKSVAKLTAATRGLAPKTFRDKAASVPLSHKGVPIATPKFIERAQSFGIAVFVWTINDRPTMERLLDLGVDAIMTDEVELLREVYTERGLWPPANPAMH